MGDAAAAAAATGWWAGGGSVVVTLDLAAKNQGPGRNEGSLFSCLGWMEEDMRGAE